MTDENQPAELSKEEREAEAQFELLVQLIDTRFESLEFLELLKHKSLSEIADIAASFENAESSDDAIVLLGLVYVFTQRLLDSSGVLGHAGTFSRINEGISHDLANVTAEEVLIAIEAMFAYVRVSVEGDVVIVDDHGKAYIVVSMGHQILPLDEPLEVYEIPKEDPLARELFFNAIRGIVKLDYEKGMLLGLVNELDMLGA